PETIGVLGMGQTGEHFAQVFAVGDFNHDGFADIAVSSLDYDGGSSGQLTDAGAVHVLYGSASGPAVQHHQDFSQLNASIAEATAVGPYTAAAGAHFGKTLTVKDVNGDGIADLIIGDAQGRNTTLFGSSSGLHP